MKTLIAEADALGENITLEFLKDAVQQLDASVPKGATATFSSGTKPINSNFGGVAANVIAELSIVSENASGSARVAHIGNTDVGSFLQDPLVQDAIDKANALNSGFTYAVNAAAPDSPWGIASARYAENISGDIVAVAHNADPVRIFGVIELEAVLNNSNVNTINGIERSTLAQMSLDDAFNAVQAKSTEASINLINKGLFDGTVEKNLYSSFIDSVIPDGEDITAHTVFTQADIDNYKQPAFDALGDFPLLKTFALGALLEGVRQLGPVGDAVAFVSTDLQAQALEEAGQHEAASQLWVEYAFETSGGLILGGAGAYAGAPGGFWTSFGLGLVGSLVGSFGGGSIGRTLYDINPDWFEPIVGGRLDPNNVEMDGRTWLYSEDSGSWTGYTGIHGDIAIPDAGTLLKLQTFQQARIERNIALDIKYGSTSLTGDEQSSLENMWSNWIRFFMPNNLFEKSYTWEIKEVHYG